MNRRLAIKMTKRKEQGKKWKNEKIKPCVYENEFGIGRYTKQMIGQTTRGAD
jgi:hypothetical protein